MIANRLTRPLSTVLVISGFVGVLVTSVATVSIALMVFAILLGLTGEVYSGIQRDDAVQAYEAPDQSELDGAYDALLAQRERKYNATYQQDLDDAADKARALGSMRGGHEL